MTNGEQPDYLAMDLPEDEPMEDWGYEHRRAYICREWFDAGSEGLLNKSRLSRQFGVSRDTVYADLDAIAGFVEENLGDKHGAQTVTVFRRAVNELLDEGEFQKAARVQNMMSDWLERRGAIDKEADEVDLNHGVDEGTMDFLDDVF